VPVSGVRANDDSIPWTKTPGMVRESVFSFSKLIMIYYRFSIFEVNDHPVDATFGLGIGDLELNTLDDTFGANGEMHVTGLAEMPSGVLGELWTFGIEGPAHLLAEVATILILSVHTIHENSKYSLSLSLALAGLMG
jgi:hypothetical protein